MNDLKVLASCLDRELSMVSIRVSAVIIRFETLDQVLSTLCYRVEEGFGPEQDGFSGANSKSHFSEAW